MTQKILLNFAVTNNFYKTLNKSGYFEFNCYAYKKLSFDYP